MIFPCVANRVRFLFDKVRRPPYHQVKSLRHFSVGQSGRCPLPVVSPSESSNL